MIDTVLIDVNNPALFGDVHVRAVSGEIDRSWLIQARRNRLRNQCPARVGVIRYRRNFRVDRPAEDIVIVLQSANPRCEPYIRVVASQRLQIDRRGDQRAVGLSAGLGQVNRQQVVGSVVFDPRILGRTIVQIHVVCLRSDWRRRAAVHQDGDMVRVNVTRILISVKFDGQAVGDAFVA